MRKVSVELAMLVRQVKTVVVEVPEGCTATDDEIAAVIWRADDGIGFEDDIGAGVQEGTHGVYFLDDQDRAADYTLANQAEKPLVAIPAERPRSRVDTR